MTTICDLTDDLLVEILSRVEAEYAVMTCLVSKRWRSLWKLMRRLDFDFHWDSKLASSFITNFLLQNKSPVLESLRIKLRINECKPEEQERWVDIAVARHVRKIELIHRLILCEPLLPCPMSLFTSKELVVLRLQEVGFWDILSTICLQSLKDLSLEYCTFFGGDEVVHKLLSGCPILETLHVRRHLLDRVRSFRVAVPSLQRLYLMRRPDSVPFPDEQEYIIDAPCLKTLKVYDEFSWLRSSLVKMPELVNAEFKISPEDSVKLLGCVASAKHLSLCVYSTRQHIAVNLCQLEYLELCPNCSLDWLCLLLGQSPKLRVLRFNKKSICDKRGEIVAQWEEPCCVPECLVSTLETVEWNGFRGTEAEKKVAVYLLEKAKHIKMMTLSPNIVEVAEDLYDF